MLLNFILSYISYDKYKEKAYFSFSFNNNE
jgi:hypothetical protein